MNNKKTLLFLIIALIVLILGASLLYNSMKDSTEADMDTATSEDASESRTPAPDFTVYSMDGDKVSFSDFKGKPVVINFWASWCGPCQSEMPHFEEAYKKYGDDIHFLMINLTDGMRETPDTVMGFLDYFGYTFPVYYDMGYDASDAYGISPIPTTFFIDKNGNIASSQIGALSASALERNIELIK